MTYTLLHTKYVQKHLILSIFPPAKMIFVLKIEPFKNVGLKKILVALSVTI